MVCCNTNLGLFGFFDAGGDNGKAFLAGLLDILLAPLQPVLNAFATLLMKAEKIKSIILLLKPFPLAANLFWY